jgi:hypothetical protein
VEESTLFPVDRPVKTSQLLDDIGVWQANGLDCSGTSAALLKRAMPSGLSGKTYPVLSPPIAALTSPPCCGDLLGTDQPCPRTGGDPQECASALNEPQSGGCLTLSTSEFHSDAVVSSLSLVLETSVDLKYSLSEKSARGILRRAGRRNRQLPPLLDRALRATAGVDESWTDPTQE